MPNGETPGNSTENRAYHAAWQPNCRISALFLLFSPKPAQEKYTTQRSLKQMISVSKRSPEVTSPAQASHGPEFLVVCNDPCVFRAVAGAVRKVNGRLNCAPAVTAARDYLTRRKVDGIVIDLSLEGAMELVQRVRTFTTGKPMVIFAYAWND